MWPSQRSDPYFYIRMNCAYEGRCNTSKHTLCSVQPFPPSSHLTDLHSDWLFQLPHMREHVVPISLSRTGLFHVIQWHYLLLLCNCIILWVCTYISLRHPSFCVHLHRFRNSVTAHGATGIRQAGISWVCWLHFLWICSENQDTWIIYGRPPKPFSKTVLIYIHSDSVWAPFPLCFSPHYCLLACL